MKPIPVIVCAGGKNTLSLIVKRLCFEQDIEIIGQANNSQEAVYLVGLHIPDVLLVHADSIDDWATLCEQIRNITPITQTLMIGTQDRESLKTAMRSGARDFLNSETLWSG